MMLVVKKKQLVVAALAVVVGTAGYFNANKPADTETGKYMGEAQLVSSENNGEEERADFFSQARVDREAGRSRSIETFNAVIENENTDNNWVRTKLSPSA